ncbi:MAG: histidine kinase [Chitinophagaceae bacterium]|nr:histidine kinase [Chitinophagaceae bacterium]
MKPSRLSRYWLFQLVGWGIFALINIFFALLFSQLSWRMIYRLLFFIELGILFSHVMREIIKRSGLLLKHLQQQIITFAILTITFALLVAMCQTPFEQVFNLRGTTKQQPFHMLFFYNFASVIPLLFIWNLIYFMYHYVMKSRKQQMDTLRLEALVKELELKTIKAHINPHFIFNSLNSIRALIDEDPDRARAAVTELSNILRSSLKIEKGETVSLNDELKIVKDYLALENMRFEDRLKIEYDVDEQTLGHQVPAMMLQTLVENAIKHGISKQVQGGFVKIISDIKDGYHLLAVQNTGYLNGKGADGFGLSSTKDRLNLLYGERARFEIKQVNPSLVEAEILIPTLNN